MVLILIFLFMLAGAVRAEEGVTFERHAIQMPRDVSICRCWQIDFSELDGDGMADLIVVSPAGEVYVFRQGRRGFPAEPTERFTFPKGTAWYSQRDIDDDGNLELVISTGDGLAYYSQNDGVFDTNPKPLIEVEQVFSGNHVEFTGYVGNKQASWIKAAKGSWPVLLSDRVIMYEPHEEHGYRPGVTTELEEETSMWGERARGWSLGGGEAYFFQTRTVSKVPSEETVKKPEEVHAYIKRMVEKVKDNESGEHGTERKDIDGDGAEDLTFWYWRWKAYQQKLTFMTFLRRADGGLPEEPDQILRYRGFPRIMYADSCFVDVNKDGLQDIVTVRFGDKPKSVRTLLEMATSEGLEWIVTVRFFRKGEGFPQRPDYKKRFTGIMPMFDQVIQIIRIQEDFNGDGLPDLRIRRSPTDVEVFFSSAEGAAVGDLFSRRPDLHFDVPMGSWLSVHDANADGIPDLQMTHFDKGLLTVFLSDRRDRERNSR